MKLKAISQAVSCAIPVVSVLFALTASIGYAGPMANPMAVSSQKVYVGAFIGGGRSNSVDLTQFGTAFFFEALGGPLAVNALGDTNRRSVWFGGAHLGFQWSELTLSPFNLHWGVTPAVEIEGLVFSKRAFKEDLLRNDTVRLPAHDFSVRYPTRTSVFLTNAVVGFNLPCHSHLHPYLGLGIGGALLHVSGAESIQVAPPEPLINHYNADTGDKVSTFAGQIKVGLKYAFNPCVNLFVEYRWLYLAGTHMAFGSTFYPGIHAETSSWTVKFGSQRYNMGDVGIEFNIT